MQETPEPQPKLSIKMTTAAVSWKGSSLAGPSISLLKEKAGAPLGRFSLKNRFAGGAGASPVHSTPGAI